ncbi:unnamed protein product [Prunus armeniaca]
MYILLHTTIFPLLLDWLPEQLVLLVCLVSADIDPEERLLDSSLIDFDRASLLYAIGNNNVSIDLPAHIFRAICLAATPDNYYETHSLPFGSLITRFAMASKVRITPPPAPASEPSPPQLNQPPLSQTKSFEKFSIKLRKRMARLANAVVRKRMARLANEVVKLTGCVHWGIPLKEPFTENMEVKQENDENFIPNSHTSTHLSTAISGLHPNKKAKKNPLAQAIGEAADSQKEFSASQMNRNSEERMYLQWSQRYCTCRLQVLKAVLIQKRSFYSNIFLMMRRQSG